MAYKGLTIAICVLAFINAAPCAGQEPYRVGWIGAMTGPAAKYAVYEAAQIALDDVNKHGGINGRKLELIFEDGKCSGQSAVTAAMKLLDVERVRYIIGGHCSPETMALAPLAERRRVVLLAASSSNPLLTNAGEFVFRITVPNSRGAEKLAEHAFGRANAKKAAVLYAETDYARPAAEHFQRRFAALGGDAVLVEGFSPGETDFRPLLLRVKQKSADSLYIGVQMPETADLFMKQAQELLPGMPRFGNEIAGWTLATTAAGAAVYEGLVYAEPEFDAESAATKALIAQFRERYGMVGLPMGETTAEAYDAVMVLAQALKSCGDQPEEVRRWLYHLKDYHGASGKFSIDSNGDGVRNHVLKQIQHGQAVRLDH